MAFEHHEPIDQVGAHHGGEECRVRTHRLADQQHPEAVGERVRGRQEFA
ncbi:hypothetical protein OHA10_36735 [Kribbella sp. NBC_00662]